MTHAMLYVDRTLGGQERWTLGRPRDHLVRWKDEILNSVCFIGTRDAAGNPRWGGTGFFVSVPIEESPDRILTYLVTARHNIERARQLHGRICIRVNRTDGETAIVADVAEDVRWIVDEDDPGNDVALLNISLPRETAAFTVVPRALFATLEKVSTNGIGIGDELGVVGLFTKRGGAKRNETIVRSGIIAAMPGEPLTNADTGAPFSAYLMELRSIGGLSGSPVFVVVAPPRPEPGYRMEWRFYLLGLLHGHWGVGKGEYVESDTPWEKEEPLNLGIGVVVPTEYIERLLDREDVLSERRRIHDETRIAEAPTPGSDFTV